MTARSFFLCLIAAAATCLAPPAAAQVAGDWDTTLGQVTVRRDGRVAPGWTTGTGRQLPIRPGGQLVNLEGRMTGLRWTGDWFSFGPSPNPGTRPCPVPSRPRGYTARDNTQYFGDFDVTFNAAETRFTGTFRWVCRHENGRVRYGPATPFTGTRRNTLTQDGNPGSSRDVPTHTPSDRLLPKGRTIDPYRPGARGSAYCNSLNGPTIVAGNRTPIRFSTRYRSRPCIAGPLEKIEVAMIDPEGKRATQIIAREYRISTVSRGQPTIIRLTGANARAVIPFAGVPARGTLVRGNLGAAICNGDLWLLHLRFSDGTDSDPIGTVQSRCGPASRRSR